MRPVTGSFGTRRLELLLDKCVDGCVGVDTRTTRCARDSRASSSEEADPGREGEEVRRDALVSGFAS
jgi:hypothetical protein